MTAQRILATLALLTALGAAHAAKVIDQPERSFELSLQNLTLPSGPGGGLTVKACDTCTYSTHVLSAGTSYFVNRQLVTFEDFSRIAEELRGNRRTLETTFVGVFIDVETERVNRVTLLHNGL